MTISTEIAARRVTFDGVHVLFWVDGSITNAAGQMPLGIGVPRDARKAVEAGLLIRDDVCLYRWAELPVLIRAARVASSRADVARRANPRQVRRQHASFCPCTECNPGRVLGRGVIAGAAIFRR